MNGEPVTTHPFTRASIKPDNAEILRHGFVSDADLYKFSSNDTTWFVKDFMKRSWLVRNTLGRFYTSRETAALTALRGMEGVPPDAFQIDQYAIAYRFVPGRHMRKIYHDTNKPGAGFFRKLEQVVLNMHERNIVHLDMRNGENIIETDTGMPMLLDFQSSLKLKNTPAFLHNLLKQVDFSGIYKHWNKIDPSSMSEKEKELLSNMNNKRKLWFHRNPLLRSINTIFNNPLLRKIFLKLRGPLTLLFLALLVMNINPDFFWIGTGVSALGEMIQVWCFASLKKQKILAANGPYVMVRNPMYIGRYFMITGGVLLTGNAWVIIGFSVIYYFYMQNRVYREETLLVEIFGESYREYCRKVNRFRPSLRNIDTKALMFFKKELFLRNHAHWNMLGWALAWALLYYFALIRG